MDQRVKQRLRWLYFCDKETIATMLKVEQHIDAGLIKLRSNCPLLADVALHRKAIRTLMSYHPFWLRLGMEAVLRDALPVPNVPGAVDSTLEACIEHKLLGLSHLTNRYRKSLYSTGSHDLHEEVGRSTLKHVFLLVLLLDRAVSSTGTPWAALGAAAGAGLPLLFRAKAEVKASKDVVTTFLAGSLHGEGDILRHLGFLGYHVTHVQVPVLEYDFRVKNLATDLRDGLRLCRLLELLSPSQSLLARVRVPATTRAACLFNCDVALQALQAETGMRVTAPGGAPLAAAHIVDGNRELTLALLWHIIAHWQLPALVDSGHLRAEIARLRALDGSRACYMTPGAAMDESPTSLLLQWAQAVAARQGLEVLDWSSSFADGRVLCSLIHFYAPGVLPLHRLGCRRQEGDLKLIRTGSMPRAKRPGRAGRDYFSAAMAACRTLGGIPLVLEQEDIHEGHADASERIVATLVAFVCCRLLSIRHEIQLEDVTGSPASSSAPSPSNILRVHACTCFGCAAANAVEPLCMPLTGKFVFRSVALNNTTGGRADPEGVEVPPADACAAPLDCSCHDGAARVEDPRPPARLCAPRPELCHADASHRNS
eukprot:jgi/Mesen1/6128/ME000313S05251